MSAKAKSMQRLYDAGRISIDGLRKAAEDGLITELELTAILNSK